MSPDHSISRDNSLALRSLVLGSLATVLAALALGACDSGGDETSELAALAPPDAPLFVEATVRPDDDRREAIESISSRLAGIEDPGALIREELQGALEGSGISYDEDIEPWLGAQAGFFIRSFEGDAVGSMGEFAAVIETADQAAAEDFLDRVADGEAVAGAARSYEGTQYLLFEDGLAAGLVGDVLVAGSQGSLKAAIDASSGESLADLGSYETEVGGLGGDPVVFAYADLETALEAAVSAGEVQRQEAAAARGLLSPLFEQPVAMGVAVGEHDVAVDVAVRSGLGVATSGTALLETVPGDAWFAYGFEDAGEAVKRAIAQLEAIGPSAGAPELRAGSIARALRSATGLDLNMQVLPVLGDAAAFLRGSSERDLEVGGDFEIAEMAGAARLLGATRSWVGKQSEWLVGPPLGGAATGFAATNRQGRGVIDVEQDENLIRVGAASNTEAIEGARAAGTLANNESFQAAQETLGDEFETLAFLHFPGLVDAIDGAFSEDDDPLDPFARGILGQLSTAAAGARPRDDGDGFVLRFGLALDE